jgi:hypothetical protein
MTCHSCGGLGEKMVITGTTLNIYLYRQQVGALQPRASKSSVIP